MPKKYDVRPYFTPEEYHSLTDTIDILEDKALIVTGVETGMRVSEITAGFPIEMIQWEAGTTQIYDEKKNSWRSITIPSGARNLLQMYLNTENREKGPVFPFGYKTANRRFKHWVKQAGIKKFRDGKEIEMSWHAVRHTFVKLSKVAGRDPMAVAQQIGDALSTVLTVYGTWETEQMARYFDGTPLVRQNP